MLEAIFEGIIWFVVEVVFQGIFDGIGWLCGRTSKHKDE